MSDSQNQNEPKKTYAQWERERFRKAKSDKKTNFVAIGSVCFLVYIGHTYFNENAPIILPLIYYPTSIIGYFLVWSDKEAALNKKWRVKEVNILFWALIGGWPGVYLARKIYRHKTNNMIFEFLLLIVTVLNVGLFKYVTAR